VAVELVVVLVLLASGRRRHAVELARFLPDCAVLCKRLIADPRVPRRAKVALWLTVPYLVSPIDLVPDFIPVIGQLDDAIVAGLALGYATRAGGREVVTQLWPGTESGLRAVLRFTA
jgi:uncharacterized membrane protein YkvA (DUF1232 family)